MTALKLYFAPGSSSMAVHIALHEIGAPFEAQAMSFHKKEMREPWYLAINPAGKVPTLVIDGKPLAEVAGCLFYLAKRFPEAKLLPAGLEAEAQAVSWMSFIASLLHPARRLGLQHVAEVWAVADRKLGGNGWALGSYSIVDIHLFRLWWRIMNAPRDRPRGLTHLDSHFTRMMERSAVKRTIEAESQIGYELPA
ncbi:MAG TPA: glutathione S-transferase N-terminal domain-containing protein [Reyranella sp.]|jgi:glutathione S-transferase|nr:glutathione S-transferase N-terminal domain-containing protein [Reyranella sp.]